jgi:4-hydroxybenzoate polyprenyltransferase
MMLLAQSVAAYKFFELSLTEPILYRLHALTLLSGMAGYWLNDACDLETDKINAPLRYVRIESVGKKRLFIAALIANLSAILLALGVSMYCFLLTLLLQVLLLCYAFFGKKMGLWGNLLVAFCSSSVFLILHCAVNPLQIGIWVGFITWSLVLSLLREILKDVEDVEGDAHIAAQSFVLIYGERLTKKMLYALLLLLNLSLALACYVLKMPLLYAYAVFFGLSSIFLVRQIDAAREKSHYSQLSLYAKLLMLTGIFLMLLV